MPDTDDMELLRRYAEERSEDAFGELVARHVNLVHSTALRATGNPQLAEEITQAVFIVLARKARSLCRRGFISGWLYQTARLTAANAMRGEIRRARREQEAHMQSIINEPNANTWTQIAPMLDTALGELNEADRSAIVLRYFQNKEPAEVAATLRLREPAARKRVSRAVQRLRDFFAKRGIALSVGVIGAAISANSVQAAPAGLAASSTVVATKGVAVSASTLGLVNGALKVMAWAKIKFAAVVGAAVIVAGSTTAIVVNEATSPPSGSAPDIQGAWEGIAGSPKDGFTHRVVMRIFETNGTYRATVDLIDKNKGGVPITRFVYKYPKVHADLSFAGGTAQLDAVLIDDANHLSGQWVQQGQRTPVQLYRTNSPTALPERFSESDYAPRFGSDLQGYWKGTLASLPVIFRISEPTNGIFQAQFDSPQEGIRNIPVRIIYNRPAVTVEVVAYEYMFHLNLEDGRNLIGSCNVESNRTFRATLKLADPAPDIAREKSLSYDFADTNELPGHWKGVLSTKRGGRNVTLHVILNVAKLPDNTFAASLDSPDEFESGIGASEVQFSAPDLHLKWPGIGSTFDAKLERGKITGTWHDDHGNHAVSFVRSAAE